MTVNGKQLTAQQVAQFAYQAGWRGESIVIATAIAHAESGFDTGALGDVGLEDNKWGPSVGLWQIRSLLLDDATGRTRDGRANLDPATNARHAYEISRGGTKWSDWSTYNSGAYKAYLTDARAASTMAGAGVTPGGGTGQASSDAGQPILAITAGSTGPEYPLTIGGRAATGELGEAIVGGSVDFSVNAVSEVTVTVSDPGYRLCDRFRLQPDGTLHFHDMPFRVIEWRTEQGPGAPHVTLVAQPEGVVAMREHTPGARTDVSPTDYMQQVATAAGLQFVGEASAVVPSIGPAQVPDTRAGGLLRAATDATTTRAENAWEVGQRLADVLGFYAYESAGTYFFASGHYLQQLGQAVQITVDDATFGAGLGPVFRALGIPRVSITKPDLTEAAQALSSRPGSRLTTDINFLHVLVQGSVARDEGVNLRPGMMSRWTQVGPYLTGVGQLVTRVSWDLASSVSPVRVEAGNLAEKTGTGRTSEDDLASVYGTTGTAGSSVRVVGPKATILDFVTECTRQAGRKYTWGGEDPADGFDCSGLIQWAAQQLGVVLPRTAGQQFAAVQKAGLTMTVAQAFKTRGAVLFRSTNAVPGLGEHIVVSLGDGKHTIEARGKAYGVVEGPITGRTWSGAGKLPGFTY